MNTLVLRWLVAVTTIYPPWQQCQLMCLHLLEVCGTAVKPPRGETCTKYEGQHTFHSFWALRSCRYTKGRATQTHTCSIYIHMYVCTYTQIHAYAHTNYVKCLMCTSISTYPTPLTPSPSHTPHNCTLLSSHCNPM